MLNPNQELELYKMVSEIYHHLGLSGQKPLSINQVSLEAQKNILKWREKKSMKGNERAKSS